MLIQGKIAIKAALKYQKRKVEMLYFLKDKPLNKDLIYIFKQAEAKNVPIEYLSSEAFNKLGVDSSSGGIAALASQRKSEEIIDLKSEIIFYLCGLEDPYNFAYSLRTLCAFGFCDILVSLRDFKDSEALILRSSAGAYDYLNIVNVDDGASVLKKFKDKGYHILALQRGKNSKSLYQCQFKGKILVILGGERRGISHNLLTLVEQNIIIPYGSDFKNALNATSALAVVASEINRRRNYADIIDKSKN